MLGVILLSLFTVIPIKDTVEGSDENVHVAPVAVAVLVLQTSYTVLVDIAANFNETDVQLGLGNVTTDDMGQYVVEVESTRTAGPFPGSLNLTVSTTLGRPDVGNYTLHVKEPVLDTVLAAENFTVVPWSNILFSTERVVASLKTYLNYNEAELKAIPPLLHNETRFWVNSTSVFPLTLGIELNATMNLYNISLGLTPPQGVDFNLTLSNWTYGQIDARSSAEGYFDITTRDVPPGGYNLTYTLNYTYYNVDAYEYESRAEQGMMPFGVYALNANWDTATQTGTTHLRSPFNDNQTSFFYNYTTLITADGYDLTTWQSSNSTVHYSNYTVRTNPYGGLRMWLITRASLLGVAQSFVIGAGFEAVRQLATSETTRISPEEAAQKMLYAGLQAFPLLLGGLTGAAPMVSALMRPITVPLHQYVYRVKRFTSIVDGIDFVQSYIELLVGVREQLIVEALQALKMENVIVSEERHGDPPTAKDLPPERVKSKKRVDPVPSKKRGSNVQFKPMPPTRDLTGEWTGTYVWTAYDYKRIIVELPGGSFYVYTVHTHNIGFRVKGTVNMLLYQSGNNITGIMRRTILSEEGPYITSNRYLNTWFGYRYYILDEELVYGTISGSSIELWGTAALSPYQILPVIVVWRVGHFVNSSSGYVWGLATERMQFTVSAGAGDIIEYEGYDQWGERWVIVPEAPLICHFSFEASLTRVKHFPLFIAQSIQGNATISREGINVTLSTPQEIGPRDYVIIPDGIVGLIRPDGTVEHWKNTVTTFLGVEERTTLDGTTMLHTIPPPPPPIWLKQKLRDEIKVDPEAVTLPVELILTIGQWITKGTITRTHWVPLLIHGSIYVHHVLTELFQEPILNSTIVTPDAIVTPRGTEYTVDVDTSGTRIRVLNGSAFVSDRAYNRTIEVNQEMFMPRTGGVLNATVKAFDPNLIDKWWSVEEQPPTQQPPPMPPWLVPLIIVVTSAVFLAIGINEVGTYLQRRKRRGTRQRLKIGQS